MNARKKIIKATLLILFFLLLILAAYGSFFIWKINETERKIDVDFGTRSSVLNFFRNLPQEDEINLKGKDSGRINVLLLGIAGNGRPGKNLTDTLMVASVDTKTNKVALLSIPRDLYVEVPGAGFQTKINMMYQYGLSQYPTDETKAVEPVKEAVKNITSLDIHYWAVVNFDGFQKIIDDIGGINIMNERDIYDPRYPGPGYSYETFELKKGFHHLDGATALKYARMRHSDPEGDFGRAKRQQQVIQATKNKIFSAGTFLNALTVNKLLSSLGDNIKTNLDTGELDDFLMLLKRIDTDNIANVVLAAWDRDSLLKVSHVFYGDTRAFILVPRIGNWSEVEDLAKNIFDTNEIKRRREEISKENARVVLINKSGNDLALSRIQKLLKENFGYKNTIVLYDSGKNLADKSVVYDMTENAKPFTLDELVKKLPAEASYSLNGDYGKIISSVEVDLVVVVGKDLIKKYNMEEDSIEEYNKAKDTEDYGEFMKL